ncbi:hypothetical protein CEUSTIGMA_g2750.t1 [Chlamydomonas eustigma]|uniref:Uncharacterized protein n=1 Tax=Chlamydomonas eustigma TaxID=1157962 RepID=A0A250WWZ1_9CHLO|nr:hypothetical protein CEUSTIGMA_g2750.t1 [Chlamydomonas eustigma]|eukprot:GAX75305.1 hypothetical protein CEUSTIGMA_g2750.t1 [Chlamydomonas eustigma]
MGLGGHLNQDDAIDKYEFLVYMASAYRAADVELYKKIHFEEGEFWSSGGSFGGLPTENPNSAGSTAFNGKAPQRKASVSQAGVSFSPSKSPPVSANADSAGMSSRRCSYRDWIYDNEVYRSVITPSQLSRSHQNGAGERTSISGKVHSSLLPNPSAPSPASSTAGIEFQSPFDRVSVHILDTSKEGGQEADEGEYSSPLLVDPDHHHRDPMNHGSSGQTGGFLTDEGLHMEIGAETLEENDGGKDTSLDRRKAEKNARLSGIMSSLMKLGEEKQERDVRLQPHLMGSANRLLSCPPPTAFASSWQSRRASSFSPHILECLMREHQSSAAALTSSQAKRSYQVSSSNQLLAESVNMGSTSSMQGSISLLGSAAMDPRCSASSRNSNSRPSSQVSAATSPSLLDAGKDNSRHIPQRRHSRGALWFMQAFAGPPSKLLALAKRKSSVLMDLAPHQAGPTDAASLAAQDAQFQPPNRTLSNTRHHSAAPASVVAAAASQISVVLNAPGDGLEGLGAAGGGLADKVGRSRSGELHISNQLANFADDAMTPSSRPLLKVGPGRPVPRSSTSVAAVAPCRSSSQQQLRAQPTASSSLTDGQHSSILMRVSSSAISKDSSFQNGTLSSPFSGHRRLSFATDRIGTSTTRHGNPNSDVYARKPPRSQRPQHGPHSGLLAAADRAALVDDALDTTGSYDAAAICLDEGGVHHADDNAMRAASSPLVDFQQKSAGNDQLLYGMTSALSSPSNDMSQGGALLQHMTQTRPKTASPGFGEKHATASAGEDGDGSMPASVQRSGTASQYPATDSLQSAAYLLSPRPPAPSTSGIGSSSSSSARSQRLLLAMTSSDLQTSHADALSNMLTEPSPVISGDNDHYQMWSRRPAASPYFMAPGTSVSNHNSRGGTTPMSASSSTPRVPTSSAMTGSKADEARL